MEENYEENRNILPAPLVKIAAAAAAVLPPAPATTTLEITTPQRVSKPAQVRKVFVAVAATAAAACHWGARADDNRSN